MASNSSDCASDDTLCIVRQHQLSVIIVPVLLFFFTLITLLILFLKVYCPDGKRRGGRGPGGTGVQPHHTHTHTHIHRNTHRHTKRHTQPNHNRRTLQGIDAPVGIDPLEHEQLPMQQSVRPVLVPQALGGFTQIRALPRGLFDQSQSSVSLYSATMGGRGVVLHVLKDTATPSQQQHFLSFSSFLSSLGHHPFLPALVGVASVRRPLMLVVEELQHRDLLGFLWRCRQAGPDRACELTERRIFTMASQVASALWYLHTQGCIHGNVGARSVLVSREMTAKLWGLGPAHHRRAGGQEAHDQLKKWKAPEVLSGRTDTSESDVWSFGLLLFEMVTLGDPPFAEVMTFELLQHLQRGNHVRRPSSCSSSLYAVMKSCCRWTPSERLSVTDLISKLQSGETSANHSTALRAAQPIDLDKYLQEAGYGDAINYAVL